MEKAKSKNIRYTFPVVGMKCPKCVAHVDEALKVIDGVSDVIVNLQAANATVVFDSSVCSISNVCDAVVGAGYEIPSHPESITTTLSVKGMMCMKCVAHVDEALKTVEGITTIFVDLSAAEVTVTFKSPCTIDNVRQAITEAGYEVVGGNTSTETLPVKGMKCMKCVAHVEEALKAVDGVKEYNVNLKEANITVTFDTTLCSVDKIRQAVCDAGYQMPLDNHEEIITKTMPVKGMVCKNCVSHVEKALKGVEGIQEFEINLKGANITVTYDTSLCSDDKIREAVTAMGYQMPVDKEEKKECTDSCCSTPSSPAKPTIGESTCNLPVVGMSCAACAARVNKALNSVKGVSVASVNFAASTALISFNPDECSVEDIQKSVREAGYDLLTEDKEKAKEHAEQLRRDHYNHLRRSCIGAWVLSIPIMIASMMFADNTTVQYGVWIASTISIFAFGRDFFINAWKQLMHLSFNMDTLVANSTGIAYLFSVFNLLFPEFWEVHGIEPHLYFETSSGLISFILLGRTLEARAKRRTSASIEKLIGLRPKRVTVIRDGEEKKIPISLVQKGDVILVHNGERVAVDGTVVEGTTYIDESMLSGEPIPVFKKEGSEVFSGTMNNDAAFKFRADKVGDDTILAQIIRMVEEAQGSRAPIQNVVDKIAGIFVPTIIILSLLTFCAWYFFAPSEGFSHGLLTMMTVLVIACPCALGLATPTAIMVGIGRGADAGILIKDAESLQTARKIDTVVLDKTGTLTEGHPEVVGTLWDDDTNKREDILVALEHQSEHPLAQAVVLTLQSVTETKIDDVKNIPGVGVSAVVDGITYSVGNEKHLHETGIKISDKLRKQADSWLDESHTLVWFADDKNALAVVALNDKLKDTSVEAVRQLHSMGIDVCLLTGDNQRSADVVAAKVGITNVKAGVLPQDKAGFIQQLRSEGKCVAMVGDGINDSAALANADLSVAMGHGSDVAIDASGVTILSSDLVKIPEMIRLSHATMRILHENLFWALIYNSICIPIAAGVLYPFFGILLHPMIGGAAMAFSSVSVVTNSLRLARVKLDN